MFARLISTKDPDFLYDVPDVLYKYRDINNENHKNLLFKRELYFSSISQFNDPFDGTIPYRFNSEQLTPDNIFLKYREILKYYHPDWNEEMVHQECFDIQSSGLMHDSKHLEKVERDVLDLLDKQFGIVCLCKNKSNFLLWSHYANCHTGFAIGFDKKKLFNDTQAHFAHMQYQEELPVLSLFEDVEAHFEKLIGTKSKIWQYEEEYRLSKIGMAGKTVELQKETIVEVIFGCKMPHEKKVHLIEFLKNEYPHIRTYDTTLSKTHFKLEFLQLL